MRKVILFALFAIVAIALSFSISVRSGWAQQPQSTPAQSKAETQTLSALLKEANERLAAVSGQAAELGAQLEAAMKKAKECTPEDKPK
jgi:hypothetical protein